MKKNVFMRAALLLLVLTLITSCFVGGTFAKYVTSGEAGDTARVAKWGVEITANVDGSAYAKEYEASEGSTATGIVVKADEKVVAPGTSSAEVDNSLYFTIKGTPEVASKVTTTFTGTDIYVGDYHPVVFTLSILDNNAAIDVASLDWTNAQKVVGTLETIQTAIQSYASFNCEAGEVLDAAFKIEWAWEFGDPTNNVNDTLLGDLAAGTATTDLAYSTTLSYNVQVTIEQID